MPNRDKTGPEGKGQRTGKGRGICEGGETAGNGCRRGQRCCGRKD